jgi:hypothetical protein
MSTPSFWETLVENNGMWCSTCETLGTGVGNDSMCQVCKSVYEDSYLVQALRPMKDNLKAYMFPFVLLRLFLDEWVERLRSRHHTLLLWILAADDHASFRDGKSPGEEIAQKILSLWKDFLFRMSLYMAKPGLGSPLDTCTADRFEQQFRLMHTLTAIVIKWLKWADGHERSSRLQIDRTACLARLSKGSLIDDIPPLGPTETAAVGIMNPMYEMLVGNSKDFFEVGQHYQVYWNMPTIDLRKHPSAMDDATLHLGTGARCKTVVVQTGSMTLPSQAEAMLLTLERAGYWKVDSECNGWTNEQGPLGEEVDKFHLLREFNGDFSSEKLRTLQQGGTSGIVVVTTCMWFETDACVKRCKSILKEMQPPMHVPVVVAQGDTAKLIDEYARLSVETESLKCKLTIEASDHDCSICGDIMDKAVQLPACKHFMHEYCAEEWLSKNDSCPYCRTALASVFEALAP